MPAPRRATARLLLLLLPLLLLAAFAPTADAQKDGDACGLLGKGVWRAIAPARLAASTAAGTAVGADASGCVTSDAGKNAFVSIDLGSSHVVGALKMRYSGRSRESAPVLVRKFVAVFSCLLFGTRKQSCPDLSPCR